HIPLLILVKKQSACK
ncbi:hypothetical protein D046_7771B, partial [Vibrio parahaemolyticus V-223/04]